MVSPLMPYGLISAVNAAEVYTKLTQYGPGAISLGLELLDLLEIVPFTAEQARATGALRPQTKKAGLSLGDRACLALGTELGAEVYTAEEVWGKLGLPCAIRLIRQPRESVQ